MMCFYHHVYVKKNLCFHNNQTVCGAIYMYLYTVCKGRQGYGGDEGCVWMDMYGYICEDRYIPIIYRKQVYNIYLCVCVCVYVCVYMCVYICVCVYMCVYICVCVYVCVYMCVCIYVCVYMCVYICVFI